MKLPSFCSNLASTGAMYVSPLASDIIPYFVSFISKMACEFSKFPSFSSIFVLIHSTDTMENGSLTLG